MLALADGFNDESEPNPIIGPIPPASVTVSLTLVIFLPSSLRFCIFIKPPFPLCGFFLEVVHEASNPVQSAGLSL